MALLKESGDKCNRQPVFSFSYRVYFHLLGCINLSPPDFAEREISSETRSPILGREGFARFYGSNDFRFGRPSFIQPFDRVRMQPDTHPRSPRRYHRRSVV